MKLRFPCKIKDSMVVFYDRDAFYNTIEDLDGDYYLELHPTGVRSAVQNNYYWFCVELLAESNGNTKEEMSKEIKKHFNIEHTSLLTKKEFARFIEDLVMWAADFHNVYIPDPNSMSNMSQLP